MAFHQRHPSHRVAALTRPRLHPLSAPPRGRLTGLLWLVLPVIALAGCKVSKDQVRGWGDSKDAYRLAKVVKDGKQKLGVRQEAAYQLVRIERFYELEKALKDTKRDEAHPIVADLAKRLMPVLKQGGGDPTEIVRAKDGLFSAWYFAAPKVRRQIEPALADWIVNGPYGEGGDHPIRKILNALGRRGANLVAERVPVDSPQLYVYDKNKVVSDLCLLGYFWRTAGPSVRAATARRFMKAVNKNKALAVKNQGAALLAIGAIGGPVGVDFLLRLMSQDKDIKVRAFAAVALRIAAKTKRSLVGPAVRDAAIGELKRIMKILGEDKPPPNPTVRGVSYIEHLLELVLLFKGEPVFSGLTPVIDTPYIALKEPDYQGIRTFVRLLSIHFLMRLDAARALRLAYAKLPKEEPYPLGYLKPTVLQGVESAWKKKPQRRPALLAAIRQGLSGPTWVAKIIAVELLGSKVLTPRKNLAADIASLKALYGDQTALSGSDWQGATLGAQAKKAVESLGKTK